MNQTNVPPEVLTAAVVFLHRLHDRMPDHRSQSGHRLFLAAFIVAYKVLYDNPVSNRSWTMLSGVWNRISLRCLNSIERELLGHLGWEVLVSREDIKNMEVSSFFAGGAVWAEGFGDVAVGRRSTSVVAKSSVTPTAGLRTSYD